MSILQHRTEGGMPLVETPSEAIPTQVQAASPDAKGSATDMAKALPITWPHPKRVLVDAAEFACATAALGAACWVVSWLTTSVVSLLV